MQQALTNADTRALFDILLGAGLMLVAHVHNRSCFTSIGLLTEKAIEILLDQCCDPAHCPLLSRAILAAIALTLHTADRTWNTLQLRLALRLA